MTPTEYLFLAAAGFLGGAVNAVAGGGTLVTFPVLLFSGIPATVASMTSTVALSPGYFGGAFAQRRDLSGQGRRARLLVPLAALGGLAGGVLLTLTEERLFRAAVPPLLLVACALLAMQDVLKRRLQRHTGHESLGVAGGATAVASVYAGYFGAGVSVILLAVLGVTLDDELPRLNAMKQVLGLTTNLAAAAFFVLSVHLDWIVIGVMALAALAGGAAGGRLASRIRPVVLRRVVIAAGVTIAVADLIF